MARCRSSGPWLVAAAVAALTGIACALNAPPEGLQEKLDAIAKNASATWNCSFSLAIRTATWKTTAAHGTIDFSTSRQAKVTDRYALGSMIKPLTGSNILRLISEGHFGLDDAVAPLVDPILARMAEADPRQHFKSMAELWGATNVSTATVRQLLSMTSAVPDFDTATPCFKQPCVASDSLRAELYKMGDESLSPTQLMSQPWVAHAWRPCKARFDGEPFCYSSTNFMLLGLILAAHAGADSWSTYNQSSSLPPALSPNEFSFAVSGVPASYTPVRGYDRTSYNQPAGEHNDHDNGGVAGVFAGWSASDLVAAPSAVADLAWEVYGPPHSIAPKKFVDMMVPSGGFYGLATQDLSSWTGRLQDAYGHAYGHMGATYGYQSLLAFAPQLNFSIAVATNIETDYQQQPADAFCYTYNAVLGAVLGKETQCTFSTASGYFGSGCKCEPIARNHAAHILV